MKTFPKNVFILSFFVLAMCFSPTVALSEDEPAKDGNTEGIVYMSGRQMDFLLNYSKPLLRKQASK
jgi:hypothetical protein